MTDAHGSSAVPVVRVQSALGQSKSVGLDIEEVLSRLSDDLVQGLAQHIDPCDTSSVMQRLLEAGQLQLALRELEHEEVILHGSLWLPIVQSHPLILVVPD